jgi:Nicotianamine synthase protein
LTDIAERFARTARERIVAAQAATDLPELHERLLDLEHLVLADVLTPEEEVEAMALLGPEALRSAQDLFGPFETALEESVAAAILASAGDLVTPKNLTMNYLRRYSKLAEAEIALAGIRRDDRVLFIGSGPLPITAIQYALQTGCTVECVDQLVPAVEVSRHVLKRLGLEASVQPTHARGQDCPVDSYDVILVGVLAAPKEEILAHVDDEARTACRILCRTTVGVRQIVYPQALDYEGWRLRPAGFSTAAGDQVLSARLLVVDGDRGKMSRGSM